jgi:1-acyl-sn-glycerol-3-phosphate acyltransferase
MFLRVLGRKPDPFTERSSLAARFRTYLILLKKWRVLELEYSGFEDASSWTGSIIAPNHPSILDAVFLLESLPSMDCVMTARLLRNPVTSGAVGLCDYIRNDAVPSLIKTCRSRLSSGSNILIFPEGARTKNKPVDTFHPVYVLAAKCCRAPIRTIMIECDSDYFGKQFSHFKPSRCPIRFKITVGRVFQTDETTDTRGLSADIEEYFRTNLSGIGS